MTTLALALLLVVIQASFSAGWRALVLTTARPALSYAGLLLLQALFWGTRAWFRLAATPTGYAWGAGVFVFGLLHLPWLLG